MTLLHYLTSNQSDKILRQLCQNPGCLEEFIDLLSRENEEVRWQAIELIGQISTKLNHPTLNNLCKKLIKIPYDPNSLHLQALGMIVHAAGESLLEYTEVLLERLKSSQNPDETAALLWAIGRIGPATKSFQDTVRNAIHPYISSSNPEIASIALQAMNQFGGLSLTTCTGKGCC